MRKILIGCLASALATLGTATLPGAAALAGTGMITVSEDTYTSQSNPSVTHGSATSLNINAAASGDERRVYLKFNVTGIPGGATSIGATLSIWSQSAAGSGVTFTVYQVPSTWTESALTWNNQPSLGTQVTSRAGLTNGAWNTFDLSSLITGNGTYAVAITASGDTVQRFLTSKEDTNPEDGGAATLGLSWTAPTILQRHDLIYGLESAPYKLDGGPAATSTAVQGKMTDTKSPVTRWGVPDCFTGMTCGSDGHTGTLSRSTFDSAIQGLTVNGEIPWIELPPVTAGTLNLNGTNIAGTKFCPPGNGSNWGMNLTLDEAIVDEIGAHGGAGGSAYTGPVILESSNEGEFDCYATWGFSSAGAVGVSKNLGDMYVATMPALLAHARSADSFSSVTPVGYIGIGGGPQWGTSMACTVSSGSYGGYTCGYNSRWVNEFNTEVQAAYAAHGNSSDYLPAAESIHAYCHGGDFSTQAASYAFDDGQCQAYYRNWITQARSGVSGIWGSATGNGMLFAISEWNAGICPSSTNCWSGWGTSGAPGSFYDKWLNMLQGNGATTGSAGTRYWDANLFEVASNTDGTVGPDNYNVIKTDGTTPAWYDNFKAASLNDANR